MKCYNCDCKLTSISSHCPDCGIALKKEDFALTTTKKILDHITNIQEFAHFLKLPYFKSKILFVFAGLFMLGAIYFVVMAYIFQFNKVDNITLIYSFIYLALALISILCLGYGINMFKLEKTYQDFLLGDNHYYILWPLINIRYVFIVDANDHIPTSNAMEQRIKYYEKRDVEKRILRFNSHKFFHIQKAHLFYTKDKFYKRHMGPQAMHVLRTYDYSDDSICSIEGVIHGFLFTENRVVTIYNTPKLTSELLKNKQLLK